MCCGDTARYYLTTNQRWSVESEQLHDLPDVLAILGDSSTHDLPHWWLLLSDFDSAIRWCQKNTVTAALCVDNCLHFRRGRNHFQWKWKSQYLVRTVLISEQSGVVFVTSISSFCNRNFVLSKGNGGVHLKTTRRLQVGMSELLKNFCYDQPRN